jgi:hypothetical protein
MTPDDGVSGVDTDDTWDEDDVEKDDSCRFRNTCASLPSSMRFRSRKAAVSGQNTEGLFDCSCDIRYDFPACSAAACIPTPFRTEMLFALLAPVPASGCPNDFSPLKRVPSFADGDCCSVVDRCDVSFLSDLPTVDVE